MERLVSGVWRYLVGDVGSPLSGSLDYSDDSLGGSMQSDDLLHGGVDQIRIVVGRSSSVHVYART